MTKGFTDSPDTTNESDPLDSTGLEMKMETWPPPEPWTSGDQ